MTVRGLAAALNAAGKYKFREPEHAVDHLVIGGGVVGLAIARHLTQFFPSKSTFLVERHGGPGEETSSRNSEVVHAGLYYPADSLKTKLCLRGRHMLHEHCDTHAVPYNKTGKLVVAHPSQLDYINDLHTKAQQMDWPPRFAPQRKGHVLPTTLISGDEARVLEPDLSPEITVALYSPETGIVDSHALMSSLEKDIGDAECGELVYGTSVVRVDPVLEGWVVQMVTGEGQDGQGDAILAKTLINSSGLSGHLVLNALLPKEQRIPMYYGRGSYASYKGPGMENVSHLIYPCPDATTHAFQSLGTHLTLDLSGNVRFGPDLDWLEPEEGDLTDPDFWQKMLTPNDSKLEAMHKAVQEYLPGVALEGFKPDYCGVRPKLIPPGSGFHDFVFRTDYPETFLRNNGAARSGDLPMITLLGIESPGLTSCLAIAEMVVEDMLCSNREKARIED